MKARDVVTGFIVVLILIGGALFIKKAKSDKIKNTPSPTPSIQEKITSKFGGLMIPSDADTADLKDVSGGSGLGIATRNYKAGKFELTVLADLPEPETGYYYQAWIVKEDGENIAYVNMGELRMAKGGYLTDFSSSKDFTDFKKVIVTKEKTSDLNPEKPVLEGAF